jgi:hypothetical protein
MNSLNYNKAISKNNNAFRWSKIAVNFSANRGIGTLIVTNATLQQYLILSLKYCKQVFMMKIIKPNKRVSTTPFLWKNKT